MAKKFTYEEHIKKHTKKENTYNPECEYCNPELTLNDVEKELRRRLVY